MYIYIYRVRAGWCLADGAAGSIAQPAIRALSVELPGCSL